MATLHDFDQLLNSMASAWVVPGLKARLVRLGVNWREWPEGDAKGYVRRLESRAERLAIVEHEMAVWEQTVEPSPQALPEDDRELISTYERFLFKAIARRVKLELTERPEAVVEICRQALRAGSSSVETFELADEMLSVGERLEAERAAGTLSLSLPRFPILSEMIGGIRPGRVMVLGAVTGFGKTTLALNLSLDAVNVMDVLFVNQEMTPDDFVTRAIQVHQSIPGDEARSWTFDKQKLVTASLELSSRRRFQATTGRSLTLTQIEALIVEASSGEIKLLVIDYDQKISQDATGDEWKALQRAIQTIEEMAKAHNLFVILLSQFHDDGRLKASDRMKQSATTVAFFTRSEDGYDYFLEFQKNRFGSLDERLQLGYTRDTGRVAEIAKVAKPRRRVT